MAGLSTSAQTIVFERRPRVLARGLIKQSGSLDGQQGRGRDRKGFIDWLILGCSTDLGWVRSPRSSTSIFVLANLWWRWHMCLAPSAHLRGNIVRGTVTEGLPNPDLIAGIALTPSSSLPCSGVDHIGIAERVNTLLSHGRRLALRWLAFGLGGHNRAHCRRVVTKAGRGLRSRVLERQDPVPVRLQSSTAAFSERSTTAPTEYRGYEPSAVARIFPVCWRPVRRHPCWRLASQCGRPCLAPSCGRRHTC